MEDYGLKTITENPEISQKDPKISKKKKLKIGRNSTKRSSKNIAQPRDHMAESNMAYDSSKFWNKKIMII